MKNILMMMAVVVIVVLAWYFSQSNQVSNQPINMPIDRSVTPHHMQGHDPEEISLYWDRREALGNPMDEPAATAVSKIIAYQLNLDHYLRIDPADLKARDALGGFDLDPLDVVELTFDIEQSYDGRLVLPDYADVKLLSITVGDLIRAAEQIK